MSECPSDGQLLDHAEATATPAHAAAVARHMNQCTKCRNRLKQHLTDANWLKSLLRDLSNGQINNPGISTTPDSSATAQSRASIASLLRQGVLGISDHNNYAAELGPYQIIGVVGHGGMGIVLRAYEPSLKRTVAIKILRPELSHDSTAIRRFKREAHAAAALEHPNIVPVFAVGEYRGAHYIVMQCLEGCSLAELISQHGPLPPSCISHLFRQLLAGLDAAHNANLIHRDIKSSNALLDHQPQSLDTHADSQPTLKIADFGLARMTTSQTRLTIPDSVLGTPEYMSPEQARGDESIDHRSDLYSAGVVLYEMLTGRTPFNAASPSAVIHRILNEPPTTPRELSKPADPHLASLALRLLAKEPGDRLQSAADAIQALDSHIRIHSPEARRRTQRRVAMFTLAATICIAALAVVGRFDLLPYRASSSTPPTLESVWSSPDDPDHALRSIIWAEYSDGRTKHRFYRFDAPVNEVGAATLIDPAGDGHNYVIAGTRPAIGQDCLFALDSSAERIWSKPMSAPSEWNWPDCPPGDPWICNTLIAHNLDGKPGQELLVIAQHPGQCPSRLSLVDPRTGIPADTFWHIGYFDSPVRVLEDFFGRDRPAIVCRAANNKLDGFDDGLMPGERQWADFEEVDVVMILDPTDMSGLAPPATDRMPQIPPARPYAYAFLNLPRNGGILKVTQGREGRPPHKEMLPRPVSFDETGSVEDVFPLARDRSDTDGAWLQIDIIGRDREKNIVQRAQLMVDRNLNILEVRPFSTGPEVKGLNKEYWDQYWTPLVQDRQYVR